MLKKILLAFALALILLGIVIQVQPNSYAVERTTTVNAPPAKVFAVLNDFHNWQYWSPWEDLDPAMNRTYSGSSAGTGAGYSWVGNDKVGEGNMKITDSTPDQKVGIDLQFVKPFPSTAGIVFGVQPEGAGSRVSWRMKGEKGFMLKAMGLFQSMDKMIGPDFEKGLSRLKTKVEAAKS